MRVSIDSSGLDGDQPHRLHLEPDDDRDRELLRKLACYQVASIGFDPDTLAPLHASVEITPLPVRNRPRVPVAPGETVQERDQERTQ